MLNLDTRTKILWFAAIATLFWLPLNLFAFFELPAYLVGTSLLLFVYFLLYLLHKQSARQATLTDIIGAQKEELESVTALSNKKVTHLAKMSHDLRTPVHGINGLIEVLEKEPLSPKAKDYLQKMRLSSKSLLDVIGNTIEFSKLDKQTTSLQMSHARLLHEIEDMMRMFTLRAEKQGLDLRLHYDTRLFSFCGLYDSEKLQQVLNNLISNAIKFTDSGHIALWVIVRDLNEDRSNIRFVIEDTGIGMTAEDCQQIFDAYYQVSQSQKGRVEGSGLGVNICQEILKLMGAKLQVSSQVGVGSKFSFEISINRDLASEASDIVLADISAFAKIVLIAAPSVATELLLAFLSAWKIPVECLSTFESAIEHTVLRSPLLLLVDDSVYKSQESLSQIDAHFEPVKKYILLNEKASLREPNWEHVFKPFLPSDLFNLCKSSNIITTDQPDYKVQIDYQALLSHWLLQNNMLSILIVDDNEINQIVLHELLKLLGFTQFTFANDGVEAVQHVKKNHYDLIWMDINMPKMDGYEATSTIIEDGFKGFVFGLTAAIDSHELRQSRNECFDLLLEKPVGASDIAMYILQIVSYIDNKEKMVSIKALLNKIIQTETVSQSFHYLLATQNYDLKQFTLGLFSQCSHVSPAFTSSLLFLDTALTEQPLDLLIVDASLPKFNTDDFIDSCRRKGSKVAIIVITDNTFTEPKAQKDIRLVQVNANLDGMMNALQILFASNTDNSKVE